MTEPTQPDSTSYPEAWTPWVKRNDPNPIGGLKSGMGFDAENTDTATPYPAQWRRG